MKIINASAEIITPIDYNYVLSLIEMCGRVCYKSEDKIQENSAEEFIRRILDKGHEGVIEHFGFTVKFICDRGVSHEIVRHRLASFCQESTRYCNYQKDKFGSEITVIKPCFLEEGSEAYREWEAGCEVAERTYFSMLSTGSTPQEARSVLPNSLKTEVIMTTNIREWRHFLKLRTSLAAHPQMREVANKLKVELKEKLPIFFSDIS